MEIIYKTGNLLDCTETVLVHGCNASGIAYNSGVAGQIRARFPFAYEAYRHSQLADLRLGNIIWAIDSGVARIIGNAITQQDYGRSARQYVSYDAVRAAMIEVRRFISQMQDGTINIAGVDQIDTVAMPAIGAGLGNGKWSVISKIIEEESQDCFQPVVYLLNGKVPEN